MLIISIFALKDITRNKLFWNSIFNKDLSDWRMSPNLGTILYFIAPVNTGLYCRHVHRKMSVTPPAMTCLCLQNSKSRNVF